mmetsp:Transcript_14848/g.34149  ORF Transcript_14848/g.34149 Transcript_14848/m.34149 type:complete len:91 (+) Transcript_14848:1715-1987(+)
MMSPGFVTHTSVHLRIHDLASQLDHISAALKASKSVDVDWGMVSNIIARIHGKREAKLVLGGTASLREHSLNFLHCGNVLLCDKVEVLPD